MKTIFTLMIILAAFSNSNAQAILNEVYPFPSNGNHEFFEFYNNTNASVSMDNYTIVSYYEEGPKKGFLVLDVPNLTVASRGFFVGSSAIPFNYQGITNSTSSQFNWNDLVFMAANNAYLRKWELSGMIPASGDGNASYDLVPIPAGYNDVFEKLSGTGATYDVFIYRNGILLSVFLGGTGGNSTVPLSILSMPLLHVDMSGASPDFDIDFSAYTNTRVEYVIQDIGSDNGYIRLVDGYCGTWTKSSTQLNHTPDVTNGGDPTTVTGTVSVSTAVVRGNASSGSIVNYDVVGGAAVDFPVTLNVYIDNGTVMGQLDAGDTFIDSKIENVVSDGGFSTTFFPYKANIIIQTITSAGCIDAQRFIPNTGVLPVRFTGFEARTTSNKVELKWYVADNETGKQFELEKSMDGKNYYPGAIILSTEKTGNEAYAFYDAIPETRTYYRIKLTDKANKIIYSNTLAIGNSAKASNALSLSQNPVDSYLVFQFASTERSSATVNIYNTSGALAYSQKTNVAKDANSIAINLDGKIFKGIYVLEVKTAFSQGSIKFIKQ